MKKLLVLVFTAVIVCAGSVIPAEAGSICKDNTWTASEGRGTCSGHGGVAQKGVEKPEGATQIGKGAPNSSGSTSSDTSDGSTSDSSTSDVPPPVSNGQVPAYQRSYFRHWVAQADGCSTRQVVLIREAIGGKRSGCSVVGAKWVSVYDGKTTTNPSSFDIDHVVPLKEAWVSGAFAWSPARREAFANDLGYRYSLIAVTASSNRSKSDRDPGEWMPPAASDACRYVQAWVAVKKRWQLAMDAAEQNKIRTVEAGCPTRLIPEAAIA